MSHETSIATAELGGFAAWRLGTGALSAIAEMTGKATAHVLDQVAH